VRRAREGPPVDIAVLYAAGDLGDSARLIKPALLYGDRVKIYSPVAWMVDQAARFADLSTPLEQFDAIFELSKQVSSLPQMDLDPATLRQFREFLASEPGRIRRNARLLGAESEVDDLYGMLDEMQRIWKDEMPGVIEQITDSTGSHELLTAIRAGAVDIAPLADATTKSVTSDALRAATGDPDERSVDRILEDFLARVVDVVTSQYAFPLLDAGASGLIQALERDAAVVLSPTGLRRSGEVSAAAQFLGYLPYFPDLPMDEVLDLRDEMRTPLMRFRQEMTRICKEFASRSIDDGFKAEVEDAWRERVEPALAEIRESLAEHGLLREVASIALGDPRRLVVEAGGVVAAAQTDLLSLSTFMSLGLAGSLPIADVALRALSQSLDARRGIARQGFYFLHKVEHESRRRST
jgi:hypothetical protein